MANVWILAAVVGAAGSAMAQTGTLDQSSPRSNASYNLSATSLTWQQQIRCAVTGRLEGIRLSLQGPVGASMTLNVRIGAAPSSNPVLFTSRVVKATASLEEVFVDMQAANIMLTANDAFVMETFGDNSGMNLIGNYVPPPGTPLYPEPLHLNGSEFVPGWKHGFDTFMLTGAPCYANCDGSTGAPVLNVNDFVCFGARFAAADPYADCDQSGTMNVNDFVCFQAAFAAGCP